MADTPAASTVAGMHAPHHATADRATRAPLVRTYVQRIDASPEAVFPLLCPVREGEWLEGWADSCELIWSASGLAELGCVFRTTEPDGPETIWIITEHDPDRGVIVFARITPGIAASTLRIAVGPSEDGASVVAIRYTVVPTSRAGEAYVAARYDRHDHSDSVVWWERSMNHYLKTGQLLRRVRREPTSSVRANASDGNGEE